MDGNACASTMRYLMTCDLSNAPALNAEKSTRALGSFYSPLSTISIVTTHLTVGCITLVDI